MAAELDIISDEDLQAPLNLSANYDGLADTFDDVAASMTLFIKKIEEQEKTISELKKNTDVLEKEMGKLNKANEQATKQVIKLEKEMKKMDETNKKAAKSAETMAVATDVLDNATGGLASQVKLLGKQLWTLAANPIGAVIAAIGVALAAVYLYFTKTAAGADKLDSITAKLSGVLQYFMNLMIQVGDELVKLAEDSGVLGDYLGWLASFVLNKVAGGFKVLINSLKIVRLSMKVLSGEITELEGKELDKALNDWADGFVQMTIGVGNADEEVKNLTDSLDALQQAASQLERDIAGNLVDNAKARLRIEELLTIVKNKAGHSDQERIKALEEIIDLRTQEMEKEKEFATRAFRQHAADLMFSKELIKTEDEKQSILDWGLTLEEQKTLEKRLQNAELTKFKELEAASINAETKFRAESKKNVAELGALKKEIDEEEKKRLEELIKLAEKQVAIRLAAYEREQKKATDAFAKQLEKDKEHIAQKKEMQKNFDAWVEEERKKNADKEDADRKEREEKEREALNERKEFMQALTESSAQAVYDTVSFFADLRQMDLEEESKKLEENRTKALQAAGDDERKKLAINRKFDREQAKLKTKEAQANKQDALFNIAISTAQNLVKHSGRFDLQALDIATGLIQAAFVAARPLPKFERGTLHSPGQFIAGERGREIVAHNGRAMLASGPTIFSGMEGSKVFSNKQTEEILGSLSDVGGAIAYGSKVKRQLTTSNMVVERLTEGNKLLKRLVKSSHNVNLNVDESGFSVYVGASSRKFEKLRKRFYGK